MCPSCGEPMNGRIPCPNCGSWGDWNDVDPPTYDDDYAGDYQEGDEKWAEQRVAEMLAQQHLRNAFDTD